MSFFPLPPAATYATTCYGRPFGEYDSYRMAKAVLKHHIWNCPEGPMPWARPIQWHQVDGKDPKTGVQYACKGWVTSSGGEWLDHTIRCRGLLPSEQPDRTEATNA